MGIFSRYVNWARCAAGDRSRIVGLRFTTTWRCNLRCKTCSIWKLPLQEKELSLEEIDRFSRARYLKNAGYITLSGGEPSLRQDFADVVSVLHRNIPHATINLTTNGFCPDIEENNFRRIFRENPGITFGTVGLSLNGPREIHDLTRGVEGSWDRVMETYDRLSRFMKCQFSFTFCKDNVDYFDWVREFARKKGTNAYICWTVMNERFNVQDRDLVFWKPGTHELLGRYVTETFGLRGGIKNALKNLMYQPSGLTLAALYDTVLKRRKMPCYAGRMIVHVDPYGNVFPCNFCLVKERNLGNLRDKTFDEIWEQVPREALRSISRRKCMYPNGLCGDSDIYPSICNNPPFVLRWYIGKLLTGKPLIEPPSNEKT